MTQKYLNLKLTYGTIKLYLCGIQLAYLKAGIPCPLLRIDITCLRLPAILNAIKRIQGHGGNIFLPQFWTRCVFCCLMDT